MNVALAAETSAMVPRFLFIHLPVFIARYSLRAESMEDTSLKISAKSDMVRGYLLPSSSGDIMDLADCQNGSRLATVFIRTELPAPPKIDHIVLSDLNDSDKAVKPWEP